MRPALPGYEVASWADNYPELSTAITSKNFVMDIFSVIIQVIAGIGVLNLLLMAVFERTREIGLLGAMGLKPRQIATLFILEGTMIGVVGVVAGVLLGVTINSGFGQVGFDYSSFAGVADYMALISGRVYPSLGLGKIVWRVITVLVITTLAAWIPAVRLHAVNPRRPYITYNRSFLPSFVFSLFEIHARRKMKEAKQQRELL